MEAEVSPLPSELTTPPVTKMCLATLNPFGWWNAIGVILWEGRRRGEGLAGRLFLVSTAPFRGGPELVARQPLAGLNAAPRLIEQSLKTR
jgi:hypothetical protein